MESLKWTEFADDLRKLLANIPSMKKNDNRSALMRGLPPGPKNEIERSGAPGTDLRNIVYGAEGMGYLTNGEHALLIVARNALEFVEGLVIEKELSDLIEQANADAQANPRITVQATFRTRIPAAKSIALRGRDKELKDLCEKLKNGGSAAVVRAIGGMGKTELAIAVANALAPYYEGRVIWLDCGVNSVQAIQERMAGALGIQFDPQLNAQLRADRIHAMLAKTPEVLVVLDDVRKEHVEGFSYLRPPEECPLLVTSRRQDVPLPLVDRLDIDELSPEAAWTLFKDNLKQVAIAEEETAKDLAKFLEYVPLALSLTVRYILTLTNRHRPPAKPVAKAYKDLHQRCKALSKSKDPNQSVRATFDISYEELLVEDQKYLRWLGVFALNTFALDHVARLWQVDEDKAIGILDRLYIAGLVEQEDEDHWWMHDLLREYALLTLEVSGDLDPARKAHILMVADALCKRPYLKKEADYRFLASFKPEATLALETVFANWADDADLVVPLVHGLVLQYKAHDYMDSWTDWVECGKALVDDLEQTQAACDITQAMGHIYTTQGLITQALEQHQHHLEIAIAWEKRLTNEKEIDTARKEQAYAKGDIARLKRQQGDVAGALALHEEEMKVYEQLGDVRERAVTLGDIARLKADQGDVAGALTLHEEEMKVYEQLGDVRNRAITLGDIARLKAQNGDVAGAQALHEEAIQVYEQLGDVRSRAVALGDIARLRAQAGDVDGALALHEEEIQVYEQLGDVRSRAITLGDIARLKAQVGDVVGAMALHEEILRIVDKLGDVKGRAVTLGDIARLKADQGDVAGALALFEEKLQVAEQLGDVRSRAVTLNDIARLYRDQKDYSKAEELHLESLKVSRDLNHKEDTCATLFYLGVVYYRQREHEKAREHFLEARAGFVELGFTPWVDVIDTWLD